MYDRMIREHGYSIRKLADKLGKDKGYVENRLRLADAPEEIRELVSVRKDTLSHAYELLKVTDEKKRRRLAGAASRAASCRSSSCASGSRAAPDPRRTSRTARSRSRPRPSTATATATATVAEDGWTGTVQHARRTSATTRSSRPATSWPTRSRSWSASCARPTSSRSIPEVDRANLAKYLTIAKLKLENAIAMVRSGDTD